MALENPGKLLIFSNPVMAACLSRLWLDLRVLAYFIRELFVTQFVIFVADTAWIVPFYLSVLYVMCYQSQCLAWISRSFPRPQSCYSLA